MSMNWSINPNAMMTNKVLYPRLNYNPYQSQLDELAGVSPLTADKDWYTQSQMQQDRVQKQIANQEASPVDLDSSGLDLKTIAGIGGLGVGLLGQLFSVFGNDSSMTKGDIDSLIRDMRQGGYSQIGQQLSQANVSTASNLASRGLGSSTITTSALQGNQAAAMGAVGNLEAQLAQTRSQFLDYFNRLEQTKRQEKMSFFSDIGDLASLLLFL